MTKILSGYSGNERPCAHVVILDEPTAALDPVSELEIYERFDDMVQEKTAIYISHRMSGCRFCENILVFDTGKIVHSYFYIIGNAKQFPMI